MLERIPIVGSSGNLSLRKNHVIPCVEGWRVVVCLVEIIFGIIMEVV